MLRLATNFNLVPSAQYDDLQEEVMDYQLSPPEDFPDYDKDMMHIGLMC